MKIIGYARTTINDVDLTTQVDQLSDFGCQEIFYCCSFGVSDR